MSKINRHPVRRTAAGVLASALVLSGAVAAAVPAQAASGFALERIQGNDRYETSAAIAAEFGQATNIIIASGESGRTPDALAANFLAGVQSAPILLTRRDTTPEPILDQLRALRTGGATTITVVGGTAAVSDAQITSLRGLGFTVNRVAGANRYETAAEIAEAGEGASASNVGILASGVSTIDALAGGPLAYKGKHPVFLTTRDDIPGATVAGMRAAGVTSVYVLGGTAVVSPAVIAELTAAGITVAGRLAGDDRSGTSVAIANALIADFGFSTATFNLASGLNEGIDALGGAALSGKQNRVLLITNNATSAVPVTGFATARAATLNAAGTIFGGTTAVANTLETAIEAAGMGTPQVPGGVTLVANTVAQGGTLSGNVAGENIASVTVSGCGFTNSPVALGAFSLVIPASQAVGTCTLTFTVTDDEGAVTTSTQTVTVSAAAVVQGTGTTYPELASATIVQTLAAGGTTIRYTFDEALTGASIAPGDEADFATYTFASDGTAGRVEATSVRVDEADTRSVLATFAGITTTEGAAALSVATVDAAAVTDLSGLPNLTGDAALNPGSTTVSPLTAGITVAPDLVTVGNFRPNAGDPNTTLVDFTFDEAADAVADTYNLVALDGITVRTGTVVQGGGTGAGTGTTVHTVEFANALPGAVTPSTVTLSAASQARGYVEVGTVNEAATGDELNVLQAADVTGGNTETPDLVSASIIRDANVGGVVRDQILYTFDEPVLDADALADQSDPATLFHAYNDAGVQIDGAVDVRSTAVDTQVLVTFGAAENALDLAVGGSVEEGAVTEAGGTNRDNQADEVGLGNIGTGTTTTTVSGRTSAPDLSAVAVERTTDEFGTTTGGQVRYTFDEDVVLTGAGSAALFALIEADGTPRAGDTAAVGTTEDTDNQVVVTFVGTSDAILRSVVGLVDGGAVADQDAGTGPGTANPAAAGGELNPEGAQLATGSTGSPRN